MLPTMRAMLKETEQNLLEILAEFSEQQAHTTPSPDKWTALACAEHIFVVEVGVVRMLQQQTEPTAPEGTASTINREKLDKFLKNRESKIQAPEIAMPKGRFKTLAEFRTAFVGKRAELYALLDKVNLTDGVLIPHPLLGNMTKADWIYFIPRHTARHIEQLKELRMML
jgi:hypothetical protein